MRLVSTLPLIATPFYHRDPKSPVRVGKGADIGKTTVSGSTLLYKTLTCHFGTKIPLKTTKRN